MSTTQLIPLAQLIPPLNIDEFHNLLNKKTFKEQLLDDNVSVFKNYKMSFDSLYSLLSSSIDDISESYEITEQINLFETDCFMSMNEFEFFMLTIFWAKTNKLKPQHDEHIHNIITDISQYIVSNLKISSNFYTTTGSTNLSFVDGKIKLSRKQIF